MLLDWFSTVPRWILDAEIKKGEVKKQREDEFTLKMGVAEVCPLCGSRKLAARSLGACEVEVGEEVVAPGGE